MKIVFATNNAHKLSEVQAVLGDAFTLLTPRDCGVEEDIPEEQQTLEGNASQKSHYLHGRTGLDCFADDTGLEVEALGGKVYRLDAPCPQDLCNGKMGRFFAKHAGVWEALHIHCPHFAVFIAPAAKRAGIHKIAVHCHTTAYSLAGNGRRNRLLSLYAKYMVPTRFACSNAAGKMWYGNRTFRVLNNAIDCAAYAYSPQVRQAVRAREQAADAFVVGHIGQTTVKQKNHPFLFSVFAQIAAQRPGAQLWLIGAHPTPELNALAEKLQITKQIRYFGQRRDVPELLQGCDVFVFPSFSEGLPVSVVEAQAAGLPVVLSDAVTREVACTPLVKTLSLHQSPEEWAGAALQPQPPRQSPTAALIAGGWNIKEAAIELAQIYRSE